MILRWMLISAVACSACLAGEPLKPACNAKNQGQVWPQAHPENPCVQVEVCAVEVWKYRWEPVTVSAARLGKNAKSLKACNAARALIKTADHSPMATAAMPAEPAQQSDSADHR